MNTNNNLYTIVYATLMVVATAAILAFVSMALKERQQKNIDMETQLSILSSVGLAADANGASDKIAYVQGEYDKYITDSYLVNYKGETVPGDAFTAALKSQYELIKQLDPKSGEDQTAIKDQIQIPVFECTLDSGEKVYIVACYGTGLWGPIWGYIGFKSDFNTIYGAMFAHKGETPGLGAEIATPKFGDQFKGKSIFDGDTFTSIAIVKGGADKDNPHEVDAVSGGTITSNALALAIQQWLGSYEGFFKLSAEKAKLQETTVQEIAPVETNEVESAEN